MGHIGDIERVPLWRSGIRDFSRNPRINPQLYPKPFARLSQHVQPTAMSDPMPWQFTAHGLDYLPMLGIHSLYV